MLPDLVQTFTSGGCPVQELVYMHTVIKMPEASRRVAVIGAGVAGLCTLRNLLYTDKTYILTCFERGPDVGGLWFYGENTHTEEKGLPAFRSVYRDLVTSIPKQLMEFPDFPHKDGPSYLHRQQVCDYLQRYADNFGLRKYIKMNTCVQAVIPNNNERCTTWTVEYYDVRKKQKIRSDVFDYVIVCTGHHENSYTPKLEGIDDFQGDVLHILDYRVPEPFAGKTVAILGAAFSGVDIAFGISSAAREVSKMSRKRKPPTPRTNPVSKKLIMEASDALLSLGQDLPPPKAPSNLAFDCPLLQTTDCKQPETETSDKGTSTDKNTETEEKETQTNYVCSEVLTSKINNIMSKKLYETKSNWREN